MQHGPVGPVSALDGAAAEGDRADASFFPILSQHARLSKAKSLALASEERPCSTKKTRLSASRQREKRGWRALPCVDEEDSRSGTSAPTNNARTRAMRPATVEARPAQERAGDSTYLSKGTYHVHRRAETRTESQHNNRPLQSVSSTAVPQSHTRHAIRGPHKARSQAERRRLRKRGQ